MTPLSLTRSLPAAALLLVACSNAAALPGAAPPPPTVTVAPVLAREVNPADELTGHIEAVSHVEIRPRVSGYVTAVRYREGSEVAAGSVLFTIDARPYAAALERASAELSRAKASSELARADAARGDRLFGSNAIAASEHDRTSSTAAQADAALQSAAATVALAKLDVEFTEVRAPFAGRTGQALVVRGDYVTTSPVPTVMTSIVSVDPVYVYFTGDEQTYLRFAARANTAPVLIGLADEAGYPHAGKVDFVDNRVDAATGTIRVRAVVANHDKRLAPGLYARVRLNEDSQASALLIDGKAVLTDQDRKYVFAVGPGDVVERKDVKLGATIDGLRVVTSGLKEGDRVIVNGVQKVFPGAKVTVALAETASAAKAQP